MRPNPLTFPARLSRSETIVFKDKGAPRDGHIALTGDPTSMLVMWNSAQNDGSATLMWGVQGSSTGKPLKCG